MAKKNFQTGLIITGDAKGAVKATALTEEALKNLNNTNKRTAKNSASAWNQVKSSIFGVRGAVGALAPALAALATAGGFKKMIDDIDKIGKMSSRLGMTTEALSELQHVAELSGVEFNTMTMGFQRMTRRVAEAAQGTGEAKGALKELRIEAQTLSKLRPEDQFEVIAEAMAGVESQSDRVRLSMKLFDSEGVALIQTMNEGAVGIQKMRTEAQLLGLSVSQDMADSAARANDNLSRLSGSLNGVGRSITLNVIPYVSDLIGFFSLGSEEVSGFERVMIMAVGKIEQTGNELVGWVKKALLTIHFHFRDFIDGVMGLMSDSLDSIGGTAWLVGADDFAASMHNMAASMRPTQESAEYLAASVAAIDKEVAEANAPIEASIEGYFQEAHAINTAVIAARESLQVRQEINQVIDTQPEKIAAVASAYDKEIKKLTEQGLKLKLTERAFYSYQLTQLKFTAVQKKTALALYDANKAIKAQADAVKKSEKEKQDAFKATQSSLDDIDKRLNDLGASSLDIFSGPADGINNIANAIGAMSDALRVNTQDIATNSTAYDDYIASTNDGVDERARKVEEFTARDIELDAQARRIKTQSFNIVGSSFADMLEGIANASAQNSEKQRAFANAAIVLNTSMALVAGVQAVLEQGKGDPYTAFARMAAMGVMVATSLSQINQSFDGPTGGGAGGGVSANQETQGTGTVKGAEDEISKSFSNSIEQLAEISSIELVYSSKMLVVLQNIDQNTRALGEQIYSSGEFTSFKSSIEQMQEAFKKSIPLHGSRKINVKDLGIQFDASQSIGDIIDTKELEGVFFAKTQKVMKLLFGSIKKGIKTKETDIPKDVNSSFARLITDSVDALLFSAAQIYDDKDVAKMQKEIYKQNFGLDKLSFKDLQPDEISAAIAGVFSAFSDNIVAEYIPVMEEFQRSGEGMFETLIRVTSNIEQANVSLSQFGFNAVKFTKVNNKQGDVGAEIVRQTILQNEEYASLRKIMKTVNGDIDELISVYQALHEAQSLVVGVGFFKDTIDAELIGASGGLGNLTSNLESFFDSYFTEQEKFDVHMTQMTDSFKDLNLQLPTSRQEFRALVMEVNGMNDSQLLARVVALSDSFNTLMTDAESLTKEVDNSAESLEKMADLAALLAGIQQDFARLDDSALESTLNSISDSFIVSIEKVIELGGSFEDVISVSLTGLNTGTRAINEARDVVDNAFKSLSKVFADRARSISLDIMRLTNAGGVAGAEKIYYQNQLATGSLDEQLDASTELQNIIMQNYDDQLQAAEDLGSAIFDVQGYINSLLLNQQLSTLTPAQMLNESRAQYSTQLALANAGDGDALATIESVSNEYLTKAREFYASGDQYTDIFNSVLNSLDALAIPDDSNYVQITADASQQAVEELQGIQAALDGLEVRAGADYASDLQRIDNEYWVIYQDFLSSITDLTGVVEQSIERDIQIMNGSLGSGYDGTITDQQIRDFLVASEGRDFKDIYADADTYGVTNTRIDNATNLPAGTTAGLAESLGIERTINNSELPSAPAATGLTDDQLWSSVMELATQPLALYQKMQFERVEASRIDSVMGWPAGATNEWAVNNGLEMFANGGISDRPAIFGEAGAEAAIPLPDGRTVPVTLSGNNNAELIAEMILLRKEVESLRAEQSQQTADIINNNYDATEQAADKVVEGGKEQAETVRWESNKEEVA